MIFSTEQLLSMTEGELTSRVVIPLFKAMDFKDVRLHHGGALEQGKDIVMWKPDEFGTRCNYAVVVKAKPISGNAAALANTTHFQIVQAFGSTFRDEVTGKLREVDCVIVVNQHEISNEALESLSNSLSGAGKAARIRFIFGLQLQQLIERYLPGYLLVNPIIETHRKLSAIMPGSRCTISTGVDGPEVVFAVSENAANVSIEFNAHAPLTAERERQAQDLKRFIETGEEVTIDSELVEIKGLPDAVRYFLKPSSNVVLQIGPSQSLKPRYCSLIARRPEGLKIMLIPWIELRLTRTGTKETTFSNLEQSSSPYKITVVMHNESSTVSLQLDFSESATSAFTQFKALSIMHELSKGCSLILEDCLTGLPIEICNLAPGEVEGPGETYLNLWSDVSEIQCLTGTIIPVPNREFWTAQDILDTKRALAILKDGRLNAASLSVVVSGPALRKLLATRSFEDLGTFQMEATYEATVLDTLVNFGRMQVEIKSARVATQHLENFKQQLAASEDAGSLRMPVEDADGTSLNLIFSDWPR